MKDLVYIHVYAFEMLHFAQHDNSFTTVINCSLLIINYLTLWCTLITEAKVREPDGKKVVRSWYV